MDTADEQRITRDRAIADEGQLRSAPPEYVAILPWRTDPSGEQWIAQCDLDHWCGDGTFFERAAAAMQDAEDAIWRDQREQ